MGITVKLEKKDVIGMIVALKPEGTSSRNKYTECVSGGFNVRFAWNIKLLEELDVETLYDNYLSLKNDEACILNYKEPVKENPKGERIPYDAQKGVDRLCIAVLGHLDGYTEMIQGEAREREAEKRAQLCEATIQHFRDCEEALKNATIANMTLFDAKASATKAKDSKYVKMNDDGIYEWDVVALKALDSQTLYDNYKLFGQGKDCIFVPAAVEVASPGDPLMDSIISTLTIFDPTASTARGSAYVKDATWDIDKLRRLGLNTLLEQYQLLIKGKDCILNATVDKEEASLVDCEGESSSARKERATAYKKLKDIFVEIHTAVPLEDCE